MVGSFLAAMPKILLFCLPLFALYTRVFVRQSGQVCPRPSLHFHTFFYLFVLLRDGWTFLGRLTGLGFQRCS